VLQREFVRGKKREKVREKVCVGKERESVWVKEKERECVGEKEREKESVRERKRERGGEREREREGVREKERERGPGHKRHKPTRGSQEFLLQECSYAAFAVM
jgi:hypothetical protein